MIVNLNGKRVIIKKNVTRKEALDYFDKENNPNGKLKRVRSFTLKKLSSN